MMESDSDDGTLPPLLGAPPPPLPAPTPAESAPAAEETPGATVTVKRGRGFPLGSSNEPKAELQFPQQRTRENIENRRREVTTHKAGWVKDEVTSAVHKFKVKPPGVNPQSNGPAGASRALAG